MLLVACFFDAQLEPNTHGDIPNWLQDAATVAKVDREEGRGPHREAGKSSQVDTQITYKNDFMCKSPQSKKCLFLQYNFMIFAVLGIDFSMKKPSKIY